MESTFFCYLANRYDNEKILLLEFTKNFGSEFCQTVNQGNAENIYFIRMSLRVRQCNYQNARYPQIHYISSCFKGYTSDLTSNCAL
jgi:hypothetical protein